MSASSFGELLRDARRRHGLSQKRLALRGGTDQAAISRIETGEVSPSAETLGRLLNAMGEELRLDVAAMSRDYDPLHMTSTLRRPPAERLALAISWNRLAGQLAEAGERGRREQGETRGSG